MRHKISLRELENFLLSLADDLRNKMDANEYKYYIIGLIFLKKLSDDFKRKREELKKIYSHLPDDLLQNILEDSDSYGDTFFVPKIARWYEGYKDTNGKFQPAIKDVKTNIGERLNKAIAAIEESNEMLEGVLKNNIDFNATKGKNNQTIKDSDWKSIIDKLTSFGELNNENFEFPDLLGAAYEYLLKYFADSAGKKGGEFYTPGEVVRLMVQLIEPKENETIYDPTVGSGGMLIQSSQFIEENGGDTHRTKLYGQELDGNVWATCIMNMILHDVKDFAIEHGNTLEEPLFKEIDGSYKKFNKILANPPFSMNYKKENLTFKSRFQWGYPPEKKKADFLFVEHMISSLKPNGVMATVIPHGVLFRGSKEKEIRKKILEDNLIDAIIGLPDGLFYGTSIPAAILVIRKNRKPDEPILFINADKDYEKQKARNILRPKHIEKITYIYHNKIEENKYSRLVSLEEIRKNDYNLNIKRYVDNSEEEEFEDVRAHIQGGIPLEEVEKFNFKKYNFDYKKLFIQKSENYVEFKKIDIEDTIKSDRDINNLLSEYEKNLKYWFENIKKEIEELKRNKNIYKLKYFLLESFNNSFITLPLIDKFQIIGIFVEWFNSIKYDLKTISSIGFNESLISDDMIIDKFFQNEKEEIENIENIISQENQKILEIIEELDYEVEDEENKTLKNAKEFLKEELKFIEDEEIEKKYESILISLESLENKIKELKKLKKEKEQELQFKIEVKRYGEIEILSQLLEKYQNIQNKLATLENIQKLLDEIELLQKEIKERETLKKEATREEKNKIDKEIRQLKTKKREKEIEKKKYKLEIKQLKELIKEKEKYEKEINNLRNLQKNISKMTPEEIKDLVLEKFYILIRNELNKELNEELDNLIAFLKNLNEKYSVSLIDLKNELNESESKLNEYLKELGYVNE
jgi:type I restriction enzyme M protein